MVGEPCSSRERSEAGRLPLLIARKVGQPWSDRSGTVAGRPALQGVDSPPSVCELISNRCVFDRCACAGRCSGRHRSPDAPPSPPPEDEDGGPIIAGGGVHGRIPLVEMDSPVCRNAPIYREMDCVMLSSLLLSVCLSRDLLWRVPLLEVNQGCG